MRVEAVRASNYSAAPVVQEVILQVCREEPRSKEEIAELIGRAPRTAANYIRDLVKAGRLERTTEPTSPHARYRTSPPEEDAP